MIREECPEGEDDERMERIVRKKETV